MSTCIVNAVPSMANVLVGSASVVWLTVDWVDLMSARFVCHVSSTATTVSPIEQIVHAK